MALGIQRRLVNTGPLATACLKLFILSKKVSNLLWFGSKKIHFFFLGNKFYLMFSFVKAEVRCPWNFKNLKKYFRIKKKLNFEEKKLNF